MKNVMCIAGVASLMPAVCVAQLVPAWTHSANRITMGSPRLADITGNGSKEVIFGTMGPPGNAYGSGSVIALDVAGVMLPGFPINISSPIVGPVAIGDLDGDGTIEIVATSWGFLWAWNHDGSVVPGFPIATGILAGIPPALADLDGDGKLDIIVAQGPGLYVYDHTGALRPGWPVFAPSNFQAPAVGDVTGDGTLEIVAGTWAPQFPDQVPHSLYMLKPDGTPAAGFPITQLGSIRGPVSLGDVDGDGQIEIVSRSGDAIYIWKRDGTVAPGWPVMPNAPIRNAATAIGDLNGDGKLEVIIGGFNVFAYHYDGQMVAGWPIASGATGNIRSSAIIVDVEPGLPHLQVLMKISNHMLGLTAGGVQLPWSPYWVSDMSQSTTFDPSPAYADATGDGTAELVYVSTVAEVHFFDLTMPFDPERAPWPTAQQNIRNTCFLPPGTATPACYANCDGSTTAPVLNVEDFTCFINEFAAAQSLPHEQQLNHYANCDNSTTPPVLNVEDFTCFINAFAAGCP